MLQWISTKSCVEVSVGWTLESFKNITDPAVPISSLLGVCAENQWNPSELLIDKMRVFSPNIDQKLHIWPAKVIIPKLLFSDPEVKIGQEACKKSRDMIAKEDLKSKKLEILSCNPWRSCMHSTLWKHLDAERTYGNCLESARVGPTLRVRGASKTLCPTLVGIGIQLRVVVK